MLKDLIKSDAKIFFNPNDFGELHIVNNQKVVCIIDSKAIDKSAGAEAFADYGIATSKTILYVNAKDFTYKFENNGFLQLDNKHFIIEHIAENMGVFELTLTQNIN